MKHIVLLTASASLVLGRVDAQEAHASFGGPGSLVQSIEASLGGGEYGIAPQVGIEDQETVPANIWARGFSLAPNEAIHLSVYGGRLGLVNQPSQNLVIPSEIANNTMQAVQSLAGLDSSLCLDDPEFFSPPQSTCTLSFTQGSELDTAFGIFEGCGLAKRTHGFEHEIPGRFRATVDSTPRLSENVQEALPFLGKEDQIVAGTLPGEEFLPMREPITFQYSEHLQEERIIVEAMTAGILDSSLESTELAGWEFDPWRREISYQGELGGGILKVDFGADPDLDFDLDSGALELDSLEIELSASWTIICGRSYSRGPVDF